MISLDTSSCSVCQSLMMVFGCRLQNQVDEVVDVMQNNIGRVMERGERLEDLQDKSGE